MNASDKIYLQDFVSRPDSLRYHLSKHTWQDGLDTFFSHRIPFSYSTSMELAERYLTLIETYYHDTKKDSITVVELGAGLGLLTYHICELLEQRNHHLFTKTSFIITDFSDDLVSIIQQHPLHERFKDRIRWQAFDCLGDDYSLISQASVVIMNYLCDSFSTHHLEYRDQQLYEWQVASYVNQADYYIDTDVFPPRFLKDKDLYDYLLSLQKNLFSGKPPNSLLRLSHLLQEDWHSIPAQTSLNQTALESIMSFIKQANMPDNQRFNFSFDVEAVMQSILQSLPDDGLVLIYDFGITTWADSMAPKSRYLAAYGMNHFYSICFPQIHVCANTFHYNHLITHFNDGHSQFMVLYKNKNSQESLTDTFKTIFARPGYQKSTTFIANVKQSLAKNTSLDLSDSIKKAYSALSMVEQHSYNLLVSIADLLIKNQRFEDACYYLDLLEKYYGTFARAGFYLKLKQLNQQQRYQASLDFVSQHQLEHSKHSGILYEYLLALCHSENFSSFHDAFKHYLTTTDYFIPWRFFLILISIFKHSNAHDDATKLIQWLKELNTDFPDLLPPPIQTDLLAL